MFSSGKVDDKYPLPNVTTRQVSSSVSWSKRLGQKRRFYNTEEVELKIEETLESLSFTTL